MDTLAFRCSRELNQVLGAGLLGGYDGAGAWSVVLPALRGAEEQLLVESHEGLHHELQASTPWGLVGAMAKLLANRDVQPDHLGAVFDDMVMRSTQVHEQFATFLSTAVTGLERGRTLLADNPRYSAYLGDALALVPGDGVSRQLLESAIAGVLRCAMAPLAVACALDRGFTALRGSVVDPAHSPDRRLAAFAAGDGPAGWEPLLAQLRADHPDLGGDLGGRDHRQLPDDGPDLQRLRTFEEEVLLRRCYDYAAGCLDAAGTPSVAWADQADVARSLIAQVRAVDDDLAARLALVTERRPIVDDGLDYHRQRVELRSGSDCETIDVADTMRLSPAFQRGIGEDRYVCGVWLTVPVVTRQFPGATIGMDGSGLDVGPVAALVTQTQRPDGSEVTHLGLLPPHTTPGQLQRQLGDTPLIAVTSHASLLDPRVRHVLADDEPIFVVADLPVAWHISDWIRQGAQVRLAASPLEGLSAELWLAAFAIDIAPHLRFLSLGGKAGTAVLIEQVLRRHETDIVIDNRLLGDGTELAVRAILSTWRILEQDSAA